ncbi:MAG: adenylate/guanylate cyclase domain-containing protein [Chitinophagales bacterium]
MSSTRQLAAILFADMLGFTSLMEKDEANANLIREKLTKKLDAEVPFHNGRVLKLSGDGALCIFNSAIEAVRAAIAIQKEMLVEPVVPLRIGIHEGDVIFEGSDVFGDGVNVASRVESFAVAGSVFISGRIYDDIKNQKDIQAISLGRYELKNVMEPVEIYAITNEGITVPKNAVLKGKGKKISTNRRWLLPAVILAAILSTVIYWKFFHAPPVTDKSIAVLPFIDMSANHDQEYFGDGLSEELLNHLAQIPELKVIARTSSFSFKGTNEDLRVIGEKLGVAHLLEGSVRKDKNKIRITAQLIRVTDGTHLWSATYDRDIDDIFTVQDEISRAVVAQLKATILNNGIGPAEGNPEAYNLLLQGRYFLILSDDKSVVKALGFLNEGLTLDPNNAPLHAALSSAYTLLASTSYMNMTEGIEKARSEAKKAITLNSHIPDGYLALGKIKQSYDWDWTGAEADYQQAFLLDPENGDVIHRKASLARTLGKFEEAISLFQKAISKDPVNIKHYSSMGLTLKNARQFEAAQEQFRKVLELNPAYKSTHADLAYIYIFQGKPDSAFLEIQLEQDVNWKASYLPLVEYALGNKASADVQLNKLVVEYQDDWAYQIAQNYAWRGDADKAFYWLDRAYVQRDGGLAELYGDPFFDKLKDDTRYTSFMKKMKLM